MTATGAFRVRRALSGDADPVASLAARTFADAFGTDNTPEDLRLHLEAHCSPAALCRQLADPEWATLLGESSGALCGYAQLCAGSPPGVGVPGPYRQLYRLYVERAFWGSGLASQLLDAALDEARARSARHIWLTTWDRNQRALGFYRKRGFEVIGTTTFTVGNDPQHDLVLSRTLD
ncbi:MAG: GNAT family N-acetyltransferase [Gemmatimonadota bacterium]|nr:GNAT family N-acetyltransferase [Gemmatimonadota bacterium]MDH4349471.1 GNAT family N-acetyltransferase [Gemmatimonadota bacterium]MDH5284669.1 GNAT family N-acetyltransferase [Gemmatimonadota bacterium]